MVTRNDVAKLAGVSSATVSYVINNGPRSVAPETRVRVLKAVEALNYQPSAVARSLRMQRTSVLGLIVPDNQNPFFGEVTRGIEWIAFEKGYTVMICHSGYQLEREMQYVEILEKQRVAGAIWVPATSSFAPYQHLTEKGVPTVVVDRISTGCLAPSVMVDNFRGGYLAALHLVNLGHRHIGIITRPVGLSHSEDRSNGFLTVMDEYNQPMRDEWIVQGGYRVDSGYSALKHLMQLPEQPTAVFAYNDIMATGALRAAHELGLRVPEDLSIIGFDDISTSAFTCPALTTIRQNKFEMGQKCTELLLSLIQSGKQKSEQPEESTRITLGVELVVRESTGPVPKTGYQSKQEGGSG